MRTPRALPWIVCLSLLAPTGPAWARGKSERKLAKEAHKHTKQGLRYLKVGKLDAAIEELQIAYGLSQDPELLFHIAEAFNQKHDYAQSLYYYKAFREYDPKGAAQRGIDGIIGALEELIKARPDPAPVQREPERAQPPAPEPEPPPAPPPDDEPDEAPPPPSTSEPVAVPTPAHEASDASAPGRGKRVVGLLSGGTGVVLIGVGLYFAKVAGDRADEVSLVFDSHGTWDASAASAYDEGRSAEKTAIVLSAVGGAAVVTGAVLYYLGWSDQAQARGRVDVSVSGAGATLGWSCAF